MASHKQKLLRTGSRNNINEAEDRISELPDSLLYHILSFLGIKYVARTCVLSKRWKDIWTSIPTLSFLPYWTYSDPPSLSEINKFMDFVDRTLLLYEAPYIHKFSVYTNRHMSASRVHSWIENITKRKVKEVILYLNLSNPFFVPLSLFTCESLIHLELNTSYSTVRLPKRFSLPKLKSLELRRFLFTDGCSWNDQVFSYCPVLENLTLEDCTWFKVRNFCISTPALKLLEIDNGRSNDNGLHDCALKIHAPNLESLAYCGCVAKEFLFSNFQKLNSARVLLICKNGEENLGYDAAMSKLIRTISHVQSLEIYAEALETLKDFANILPTFHNLNKLILKEGKSFTNKSLFPFLKAVPNLRRLVFEEIYYDDSKEGEEEDSWAAHMSTAGCLFQHLQSVCFDCFSLDTKEMRWLGLILMKAGALQRISIGTDEETKKSIVSKLSSLPKASTRCVIEFF